MAPPQIASPSAIASAGYGKSCTACSKAKAKCLLRPDGQICERCHRLRKDCQPMISSRKRTVKKTTSSRTAQLEEKLDDLVSILRASQSQTTPTTTAKDEFPPPPRQQSSISSEGPTPVNPNYTPDTRSFPSRLDSLATAATSSTTAAGPYQLPPNVPGALTKAISSATNVLSGGPEPLTRHHFVPEPSLADAENNLSKFRAWLPNLGFMRFPEAKAEVIRRERPVLYSVIMNLTCMSVPDQKLTGDAIRKDVINRVFLESERSLDLLQGLLAFIGWAHFNTGPANRFFLLPFTQLAVSIANDLGLNKSPEEEQLFTSCFKAWLPYQQNRGPNRPAPKERTIEERRIILCLWFTTSVLKAFIGKLDTMPWTPHMDECLDVLEENPEIPSDETLVYLVRLQRINDEAQDLLLRDAMDHTTGAGGTPTYMFRKGLKARLDTLRERIRGDVFAKNANLQAQYFATEMQVQSVGVFTEVYMPEHERVNAMYSIVKSIRQWYDIFLSMPLLECCGQPFSFFIQFTQTHVVLYKLTICDDPAWDKSYLQSTANLAIIFDRSIERFQQLAAAYPMKCTDDAPTIFAKGAMMTHNIKTTWEPMITHHLGGLPTPESQAAPNGMAMNMAPTVAGDPNMGMGDPSTWDFTDTAWMTDIFGPWEY